MKILDLEANRLIEQKYITCKEIVKGIHSPTQFALILMNSLNQIELSKIFDELKTNNFI